MFSLTNMNKKKFCQIYIFYGNCKMHDYYKIHNTEYTYSLRVIIIYKKLLKNIICNLFIYLIMCNGVYYYYDMRV